MANFIIHRDGKNIKINEADIEEIIAFDFKILRKDAGKKGKG